MAIVFIVTKKGLAKKLDTDQIRATGRSAQGVIAIALSPGDEVVSVCLVDKE